MTTLLLFDIDGTLCLSGGAGARAMTMAAMDVFGGDGNFESIPMAGRTDAWIVSQMAAARGVRCDAEARARFHTSYVEHLAREIHRPGPRKGVLPGVRALLDVLEPRGDTHLALLTGNYRRGAQIKLEYFDLWRYFGAGAFGDEAHDRNTLLDVALGQVAAVGGPRVPRTQVIVIGDTPLDVAVAQAGGARSLAVATGSYDEQALRASGADAVLTDLADADAVLEALRLA
jgi:phosphoglycolate phosphatase-like HAD superfamily hydrolase